MKSRLGILGIALGLLGLWAVPAGDANALGVSTIKTGPRTCEFGECYQAVTYESLGKTINNVGLTPAEDPNSSFTLTDPGVLILSGDQPTLQIVGVLPPYCSTGVGSTTCWLGGNPVYIKTGDGSDHVNVHGWDSGAFDLYIEAGMGNDRITSTKSHTFVKAGKGDDRITLTKPFGNVDCGPGRDVATVNTTFVHAFNCETVVYL